MSKMENEKRLIYLDELLKFPIRIDHYDKEHGNENFVFGIETVLEYAEHLPTVKAYTAHEVAEILADVFSDTCACNFNSIDEWLPFKCELLDACPNPVGVACWEQYLKFRDAKMDGDGNA